MYVWARTFWKTQKSRPLHPGKIINFFLGICPKNSKKHESHYFCLFFGQFYWFFSVLVKTEQKLAKGCIFCALFLAWPGLKWAGLGWEHPRTLLKNWLKWPIFGLVSEADSCVCRIYSRQGVLALRAGGRRVGDRLP